MFDTFNTREIIGVYLILIYSLFSIHIDHIFVGLNSVEYREEIYV